MKKVIISISFLLLGTAGFSTTWTITNSGTSFTPATITINLGDDVNFNLETIHNAREVSQATWNINGNTALPGGFSVSFGGGLVTPDFLGVGTHYYVCVPHADLGMKGIIIVQNTTGIEANKKLSPFSIYPNPSGISLTIKSEGNMSGVPFFIADQAGRVMYMGKFLDETTPVDISRFTPGIYMIRTSGQRKQSVKFVKD